MARGMMSWCPRTRVAPAATAAGPLAGASTSYARHRSSRWRASHAVSALRGGAPPQLRRGPASTQAAGASAAQPCSTSSLDGFLDTLKWNSDKLVTVVVQHVDTGDVLMQAFADRAAIAETLRTGLATFYSRSRRGRWCKGETSGHFIAVQRVFVDCDRDALVYLGDPTGPACHTGARTCWFSEVAVRGESVRLVGSTEEPRPPQTTLYALEDTIRARRRDMDAGDGKPSWTAKLLTQPALLCAKVREEAGELCQTLEQREGAERTASEMADLLYHAMVLLNAQGVPLEDVLAVLRKRFALSGIEEKAMRKTA